MLRLSELDFGPFVDRYLHNFQLVKLFLANLHDLGPYRSIIPLERKLKELLQQRIYVTADDDWVTLPYLLASAREYRGVLEFYLDFLDHSQPVASDGSTLLHVLLASNNDNDDWFKEIVRFLSTRIVDRPLDDDGPRTAAVRMKPALQLAVDASEIYVLHQILEEEEDEKEEDDDEALRATGYVLLAIFYAATEAERDAFFEKANVKVNRTDVVRWCDAYVVDRYGADSYQREWFLLRALYRNGDPLAARLFLEDLCIGQGYVPRVYSYSFGRRQLEWQIETYLRRYDARILIEKIGDDDRYLYFLYYLLLHSPPSARTRSLLEKTYAMHPRLREMLEEKGAGKLICGTCGVTLRW